MKTFELNGVIYKSNETDTYFYKSTNSTDKKGNLLMMRISREAFENARSTFEEQEQEQAYQKREAKQAENDKQAEENFNKKHGDVEIPKSALEANKKYIEKKASKPRRSKDVAFEQGGVTLTTKQVDFIKRLSESNFYEAGVDSVLWCDYLADDLGGQFAGKPMTIGAMISTLREKNLIVVDRDTTREGKPKFIVFTELGKQVAKGLGLN